MASSSGKRSKIDHSKLDQIFEATLAGNVEGVKGLIKDLNNEKGIQEVIARIRDSDGQGLLQAAAVKGRINVCKYLLEELKLNVDEKDANGYTALLHASLEGNMSTVEYLIESGADPATLSKNDTTALHLATSRGNIQGREFLLSKGAIVNGPSAIGTPLELAAPLDDLNFLQTLMDNGAEKTFGTVLVAAIYGLRGNKKGVIFADDTQDTLAIGGNALFTSQGNTKHMRVSDCWLLFSGHSETIASIMKELFDEDTDDHNSTFEVAEKVIEKMKSTKRKGVTIVIGSSGGIPILYKISHLESESEKYVTKVEYGGIAYIAGCSEELDGLGCKVDASWENLGFLECQKKVLEVMIKAWRGTSFCGYKINIHHITKDERGLHESVDLREFRAWELYDENSVFRNRQF